MFTISTITEFITRHLADIAAICLVYLAGQIVLTISARKLAGKAEGGNKNKRVRTIGKLVHDVGHMVLLVMITLWILGLFGVDPTPILASAGVAGLAIGFGAQALVKDFISGIFIIAENQYGVGDHVKLGNFEGEVQILTIRSTVLKDADGNTVYIPNGSVTTVVNVHRNR